MASITFTICASSGRSSNTTGGGGFCAFSNAFAFCRAFRCRRRSRRSSASSSAGRFYPWGNNWDADRCNGNIDFTNVFQKTNSVTLYEGKGDSPYGVVDMAGNVLEWCLTDHETGDNSLSKADYRVSREGCWLSLSESQLKTDSRFYSSPLSRGILLVDGFRIARND